MKPLFIHYRNGDGRLCCNAVYSLVEAKLFSMLLTRLGWTRLKVEAWIP